MGRKSRPSSKVRKEGSVIGPDELHLFWVVKMSEFLRTKQMLWKVVAIGPELSRKDRTQKELQKKEAVGSLLVAEGRNCLEYTASSRQWYRER